MKMAEIWDSTLYISGSQSVAQEPWGIPKTISGGPQGKTMIIIILRNYLLFSLLFYFKCIVGFSNDYKTDGMAKE